MRIVATIHFMCLNRFHALHRFTSTSSYCGGSVVRFLSLHGLLGICRFDSFLKSVQRAWMEGVSALHTMSHFCVFVYVCGTLWCTNNLQTFNTVLIYAECTVLQFSNSKLHGDNVSGALIKYRYNHNLAILKFLDANRF